MPTADGRFKGTGTLPEIPWHRNTEERCDCEPKDCLLAELCTCASSSPQSSPPSR